MRVSPRRCAVVAMGGNALWHPDQQVTVADQFRHTRESLKGLLQLLKQKYRLVITHGNGPQVGAALRRVELTRGELPDVPLGLLVADTEGSMGYMIEQSLLNLLARERIDRQVATLLTQVLVDENDPALLEPTKFIGRSYSQAAAKLLIDQEGWTMKQYKGDQWRRVVGSPGPISIVNIGVIKSLVEEGVIVIAGGGGGVPVYVHPDLGYEGIDAVIDKDLASAVIAKDIGADELYILTNIDAVRLDFGKPTERALARLSVAEARMHYEAGQFPPGNMGPKVLAAITFVRSGGRKAVICDLEGFPEAVKGRAGTLILPDTNQGVE